MEMRVMVLLSIGIIVQGDIPKPDSDTLTTSIQGAFVPISLQSGEPSLEWFEQIEKSGVVVITKDQITIKGEGDPLILKYRSNSSKNPKELDLVEDPKTITQGIYKLNGDVLTICLAKTPSKPRPSEFKAKPGLENGQWLMVLKRKKS
jgi:uncharacterized protein (TIGR03067 family)